MGNCAECRLYGCDTDIDPCGCSCEVSVPVFEAIKPSDKFLASLPSHERAFFEKGGPVEFTTKDSGARKELAGGMVRDVTEGKDDWTLLLKGPLLRRWMQLMGRGAKKYGKNNWWQGITSSPGAAREETRLRFQESAFRHFMQWIEGDRTEDHAAAVIFNMNGYEAMRDHDQRNQEEPND